MDEIEETIKHYSKADDGEKRHLISTLVWDQTLREDPRVFEFCIRIVSDPEEYDLARSEILEWYELGEFPQEQHRAAIADVLEKVLLNDEDDDVRAYAAKAAYRFTDFSTLVTTIESILTDPSTDRLVRGNAFTVLETLGPSEESVSLVTRLTSDPVMRDYAVDLLAKWKGA